MKIYELLQQQRLCEHQPKRRVQDFAQTILRIYDTAEDQRTIDHNPYGDQELLTLLQRQQGFESATMVDVYAGLKRIVRMGQPILRPHPPAPYQGQRINSFDAWTKYKFVRKKFYDPIFSATVNDIIDFARNGTGNDEIAAEVDAATQGSIDTTLSVAKHKFGIDIPPMVDGDQRYQYGLNQKGRILKMLAQGSYEELDKKVPRIAEKLGLNVNNVRSVISIHFKTELDAAAARLNKSKQQLTAQERLAAMKPELLRIRSAGN